MDDVHCRRCGHRIVLRHYAGEDRWCATERINGEPAPFVCRRRGPEVLAVHEPEPIRWDRDDFLIEPHHGDWRVTHTPTTATLGVYATRAAASAALDEFLKIAQEIPCD